METHGKVLRVEYALTSVAQALDPNRYDVEVLDDQSYHINHGADLSALRT